MLYNEFMEASEFSRMHSSTYEGTGQVVVRDIKRSNEQFCNDGVRSRFHPRFPK